MYPALAAIDNLKAVFRSSRCYEDDGLILHWVGTPGGMEEVPVRQARISMEIVQASGIVGKGITARVSGVLRLVWGTLQALGIVRRFRPDIVFVTGGYSAVPVAMAAWLLRVPIMVYLPDIEPGLAVRCVARLACRILVTVEESRYFFQKEKVRVTGYPVRPEIMAAANVRSHVALNNFGLLADRLTILAVGGSHGARSINMALLDAVPQLVGEVGAQIIHVTGESDWQVVQERRATLDTAMQEHYHIFRYLSQDMGLALRAADLVVSRAGASSLGEYPAFGLPAILVPYPHAWRYQQVNADKLARHGAAMRLDDEDLGVQLAGSICDLLSDSERLSNMQAQARSLAVLDAGQRLASEFFSLDRKGVR